MVGRAEEAAAENPLLSPLVHSGLLLIFLEGPRVQDTNNLNFFTFKKKKNILLQSLS